MHGVDRSLEVRRAVADLRFVWPHARVQIVGPGAYVGGKTVQRATHVLAEVDAAGPQMRQDLFERRDLLLGVMPAVVDHDIDARNLALEARPKVAIILISDEDARAVVLVRLASGLDVDSEHVAARNGISFPHV